MMIEYAKGLDLTIDEVAERVLTSHAGGEHSCEFICNGIAITFSRHFKIPAPNDGYFNENLGAHELTGSTIRPRYTIIKRFAGVSKCCDEVPWKWLPRILVMQIIGIKPDGLDNVEVSSVYGRFFVINDRYAKNPDEVALRDSRQLKIYSCSKKCWNLFPIIFGGIYKEIEGAIETQSAEDIKYIVRVISMLHENRGS